jgi:CHASE2 domain-containing sensor protein
MVNFQLHVRRFEQTCVFELFWGKGQQLSATLAYPESLSTAYQDWQRVYLSYYQSGLRGWIEDSGSLTTPPIDWHRKLVQAEAKFLSEFHHWLRSAELFEIRAIIAKSQLISQEQNVSVSSPYSTRSYNHQFLSINVFLTCHAIELERLPWEVWEIGAEFPASGVIRIARTPGTIHEPTHSQLLSSRKKPRILVILGDETGLNFQEDKEAVKSLSRITDIEFVGWQPGQDITELKTQISASIADKRGWDVLFFAGHSNETLMTGGELAIAPNVSISIREIMPQLVWAKQRGLQFALFNSCCGLKIAASLIDLGLSQVAVMREPIHNTVAQVFLRKFLQGLAAQKDVHDSLLAACQSLKVEKNLTYPSAYLIPSLFCHPDSTLFKIKPSGWKKQLKKLLPTPKEAIKISILTLLSLSLSVQDFLVEKRLLIQSIYRKATQQFTVNSSPSILLVQIDEKSIQEAKLANPRPMDRKYLASLVDKLSQLNAQVVGIDYLLDRPQGDNDRILAQSLQSAVIRQPHPSWFVFASLREETAEWLEVLPEIASSNWSLQGYINIYPGYMGLVWDSNSEFKRLPFAYVLAFAYQLNQKFIGSKNNVETTASLAPNYPKHSQSIVTLAQKNKDQFQTIHPQLNSQTDFFFQLNRYLREEKGKNYKSFFSPLAQLQPITSFSYDWGQMWLHPIIDFSIPPAQVYQTIPAWQLLKSSPNSPQLSRIQQQVVMIAPGGYGEAGVFEEGQDNPPLPAAVSYWFEHSKPSIVRRSFTGGEIHAYMIHHYLNRRLVVPIPDIWLLGIAVVLGKGIALAMKPHRRYSFGGMLLGGTVIYGLVSLQLYISGAILLPWVFPSVTLWTYALPVLLKKNC